MLTLRPRHKTASSARCRASCSRSRRDSPPSSGQTGMSDQIRVAVVGTGYFGRFHANHYSRNPRAKLVAVVDANEERARAVAAEFGGEPVFDYRSIIGRVDAASVAVPTTLHYEVARPLIEAGINVLIEKPITETVDSALALTKLA